jgi:putative ABC transport system permease protein
MLGLLRRLRARMRYRRFDEDLDAELRLHRDLTEEALARGGEAGDEIRHRAARMMGNELRAREEVRAVWIAPALDALVNDLRFFWRQLRAAKAFAVTTIALSGAGIGALVALFTVLNAVLFVPLPYPDSDRMLALATPESGAVDGVTFHAVRSRIGDTAAVAAQRRGAGWNVVAGDHAEFADALRVSASYFDVLGIGPARGRAFTESEDRANGPRVVIISDALWRRFGAPADVIGSPWLLGGEPHEVVGVMPPAFAAVPRADLWLPLRLSPVDNTINYALLARLKPGVDPGRANALLELVKADLLANPAADFPDRTRSLRWMGLQEYTGRQLMVPLMLLVGAVAAIVIVICANLGGLQLFRTIARRHELATRLAIGGGKGRLLRQLLTESCALAALGGLAGIAVAVAVLPLMRRQIPAEILAGRDLAIDGRVMVMAVVSTMIVSLLFGLAPILETRRLDLRAVLLEGPRTTGSRSRQLGRRLLIVGELGVALALLALSGALLQSMAAAYRAEPGFDPDQVTIAKISMQGMTTPAVLDFVDRTHRELAAIAGVSAVAVANHAPVERGLNLALQPPDGSRIAGTRAVDWRFVSPEFFAALRVPVRAGRAFLDSDRAGGSAVAVVNESFARHYFADRQPIGRVIALMSSLGDAPREIVGVVADVRSKPGAGWTSGFSAMGADAPPTIYVPLAQVPAPLMALSQRVFPMTWLIRTASPVPGLERTLESAVRRVDHGVAVSRVTTMRELVQEDVAGPTIIASVVSALALLALFIAGTGIYGIVAYAASQRSRETAVRVALGATRASLLRQLLAETAWLAVASLVVGGALIAAGSRLMSSILGSAGTMSLTTVGIAAATMIGALAAASLLPALRATAIDPLRALRME